MFSFVSASSNDNHGGGGDDASSHDGNDALQEEEEEEEENVLISRTNKASNEKRWKKKLCSQPEEEAEFVNEIAQPRPPSISTIGFLAAFAKDFLDVRVEVPRSSKLPVCGSFKSFNESIKLNNRQTIVGVRYGFPIDKFHTFATSGIYKLAFKPKNGEHGSDTMALLRKDQWILCMTLFHSHSTNNVIQFDSLAWLLPDNKLFLLRNAFQMFCYMLAATFQEVHSVKCNVELATPEQLANLKTIHGSELVNNNTMFVCGPDTWE